MQSQGKDSTRECVNQIKQDTYYIESKYPQDWTYSAMNAGNNLELNQTVSDMCQTFTLDDSRCLNKQDICRCCSISMPLPVRTSTRSKAS